MYRYRFPLFVSAKNDPAPASVSIAGEEGAAVPNCMTETSNNVEDVVLWSDNCHPVRFAELLHLNSGHSASVAEDST